MLLWTALCLPKGPSANFQLCHPFPGVGTRDPGSQMRQQRPGNGPNLGVTRLAKGAFQPLGSPFPGEKPGFIKYDFSAFHTRSYFTLTQPQGRVYSTLIYRVEHKARKGPEATARRRQESQSVLEQNLQLGFWVLTGKRSL